MAVNVFGLHLNKLDASNLFFLTSDVFILVGKLLQPINFDNEIAEVELLTYEDIDKVSPVDKLIFEDLHTKGLLQ